MEKIGKTAKLLAGKFCDLEGKNKEIHKGNIPHWREICPAGGKFCPACREINIFSRPVRGFVRQTFFFPLGLTIWSPVISKKISPCTQRRNFYNIMSIICDGNVHFLTSCFEFSNQKSRLLLLSPTFANIVFHPIPAVLRCANLPKDHYVQVLRKYINFDHFWCLCTWRIKISLFLAQFTRRSTILSYTLRRSLRIVFRFGDFPSREFTMNTYCFGSLNS